MKPKRELRKLTGLTLCVDALRQIAGERRDSMARRNARATLTFVECMEEEIDKLAWAMHKQRVLDCVGIAGCKVTTETIKLV